MCIDKMYSRDSASFSKKLLYMTLTRTSVYFEYSTFHIVCIDHICYDDGCHLRKFVQNPTRSNVTPTAQRLANMRIAVDKMHIKGHIDPWCLANCDPRKIKELDEVGTKNEYIYRIAGNFGQW